MATNYIYRICPNCNGDGVCNDPENPAEGEVSFPCPTCGEVGRTLWGELRDEKIGEE